MGDTTEKSTFADNDGPPPDFTVKAGLAQMLKGGVIMDVVNAEQVYFSHDHAQTLFNAFNKLIIRFSGSNC